MLAKLGRVLAFRMWVMGYLEYSDYDVVRREMTSILEKMSGRILSNF